MANDAFFNMAMVTAAIVGVVAFIGAIGSSIEVARVKLLNRRAAQIIEKWCSEHPQDAHAAKILSELVEKS